MFPKKNPTFQKTTSFYKKILKNRNLKFSQIEKTPEHNKKNLSSFSVPKNFFDFLLFFFFFWIKEFF
jgi:hypothetical protein